MTRLFRYLLLFCALASPVWSQGAVPWKTIGRWAVSIDTSLGNGCYAIATWTGGTVLRIGLNPENDNFYLMIGNSDWRSLKPDSIYEVHLQFDDLKPWSIDAYALQFLPGDIVYLQAQSSNFEFIEEFMNQARMTLYYAGSKVETLKLRGSQAAFEEIQSCQAFIDENGLPDAKNDVPTPAGSDPFAKD